MGLRRTTTGPAELSCHSFACHLLPSSMASEKTQASFDAVTSKLNNLSAKDDAEESKPKAADSAIDAKEGATKPEDDKPAKTADGGDAPGA